MKLLKSKRGIQIIFGTNIIIICTLIGVLFYHHTSLKNTNLKEAKENNSYHASDQQVSDLYQNLIEGYDFQVGEYSFDFGDDGSYSGFFDSDNTEVSGYSYECTMENDEEILRIYNEDATKNVTYKMNVLDNGDIQLFFEDDKEPIVLKF